MSPHVKLGVGAVILACTTSYLAYLGASASWQYYVHVDECLQDTSRFVGKRVRVSGRVAEGTLQLSNDRRLATFALQGKSAELLTECRGPLPDNLSEGIDVVVEGVFEYGGLLRGDKVMTRCASKYSAEDPGIEESRADVAR